MSPPTKNKSAQLSYSINQNNIDSQQHQSNSAKVQHQHNCPLFFAQRLSRCDSPNKYNSEAFTIHCSDKTMESIDGRFLRCRVPLRGRLRKNTGTKGRRAGLREQEGVPQHQHAGCV